MTRAEQLLRAASLPARRPLAVAIGFAARLARRGDVAGARRTVRALPPGPVVIEVNETAPRSFTDPLSPRAIAEVIRASAAASLGCVDPTQPLAGQLDLDVLCKAIGNNAAQTLSLLLEERAARL